MKKSAWSGIGVATILVVKLASFAMDNPQYNGGQLVSGMALLLMAIAVIYGGIWIIQKMRAPQPLAAGVHIAVPANAGTTTARMAEAGKTCTRCNQHIEPRAKFCSECGTVA
jgi:hypothetical protein